MKLSAESLIKLPVNLVGNNTHIFSRLNRAKRGETVNKFIALLLSLTSNFPESISGQIKEVHSLSITVHQYNLTYSNMTVYLSVQREVKDHVVYFDGAEGSWPLNFLKVGDETTIYNKRENGILVYKIVVHGRSIDAPFQWATEESVASFNRYRYRISLPNWMPHTALYLGDSKYKVRERAQEYLVKHPDEWRGAAWLLTNSRDAEIIQRSQRIKEFLLEPKGQILY